MSKEKIGMITSHGFQDRVPLSENAIKVNSLELKRVNNILKIGDTIIPQKKIFYNGTGLTSAEAKNQTGSEYMITPPFNYDNIKGKKLIFEVEEIISGVYHYTTFPPFFIKADTRLIEWQLLCNDKMIGIQLDNVSTGEIHFNLGGFTTWQIKCIYEVIE